MFKNLQRFTKQITNEFIRDFTAFGDLLVILFLSFIILEIKDFIFVFLGLVFIQIICYGIKAVFFKERPNKEKHNSFLEKINASSFPSIHTARATFVYTAWFFFTNYQFKVLFLLLILIVALTRVFLKKHYKIDVVAGFILGIIVFFAMFKLI